MGERSSIDQLQTERDGLLALLRQVQHVLNKWHSSHCVYAVSELRALLSEPQGT